MTGGVDNISSSTVDIKMVERMACPWDNRRRIGRFVRDLILRKDGADISATMVSKVCILSRGRLVNFDNSTTSSIDKSRAALLTSSPFFTIWVSVSALNVLKKVMAHLFLKRKNTRSPALILNATKAHVCVMLPMWVRLDGSRNERAKATCDDKTTLRSLH